MQIKMSDVSMRFGRIDALRKVDLDLGSGITGLLGPNGAGKTTLIRMLATLQRPTSGTIRIDNLDPTAARDRTEIRRRLGYLPQNVGLYPSFTVFEFVDYLAILKELNDRRTRHQKVQGALRSVDLQDLSNRKIKSLSGGMARRVGIAQAIVGDPDLLLLDEPTVGLDPQQRARFRELIAGLGQTRQVVLSTHLVEDVAAVCTSVVVLWEGEVRFHGTPQDLRELARGRVWLSPEPVPGVVASWRTEDGTFRVVGTPPPSTATIAPTLEDGYLLLTAAEHGIAA